MTRAVLALGGNLGDRHAHLRAAVRALDDVLVAVSGVYETPPWGDPEQPDYLNAAAIVVDQTAAASDWLNRCRALELAAGRVRDPARPYGPRSLDVDVVAVWSADGTAVRSDDPELTLPHPRAHLRGFVLRPWIDIEPFGYLPGHGWLTDLLGRDPVAAELLELRPRPDLPLESAR
ncbi:2-amino-4-hydroxy-6-hydroxymethyldihydropteridine diphosphokinase [Solwaraspora sp. WMMB335]|uniref:2-amino-4-hydroxy-6- hydroxymethyldihydropteridine diphosphokinase n=1 Tax=Solwaraspora sp. WMMB335 TaxID=3404118 RepID=UPI003B948EA4